MITTKKKSNYKRALNKELKVEENNQSIGNHMSEKNNQPTTDNTVEMAIFLHIIIPLLRASTETDYPFSDYCKIPS